MMVLGVASANFEEKEITIKDHTYPDICRYHVHILICNQTNKEKNQKGKRQREKMSTIRPSKLSNSINKAFMEFNSPTEARLWVSGEHKTRVTLNTHGSVMGIHS